MPQRHPDTGEFIGEGYGMEIACLQNPNARLQRHFYKLGIITSPTSDDRLKRPYVIPEEVIEHGGERLVLPEFSVPFHVASAVSVAVQRNKEQQRLRLTHARTD